ncbi:MAG: alpha/beta hydrolase, partial [Gammaproteobacteria bacterium]
MTLRRAAVWGSAAIGVLMLAAQSAAAEAGTASSPAADVGASVVPEDPYPQRRIAFPAGVVGLPDLVYSTIAGFRPLRLDLYLPPAGRAAAPRPFVVYVHGGGWLNGHTRQSGAFQNWPNVLASLAARGYVVASVEYRLSSEARFPAAVQDLKAAIRWLRSQASAYGIDRSRGLVWGASAGGQLAALAATSCGVAALEPPVAAPPTAEPRGAAGSRTAATPMPRESDCVQGAVTWYGIFDFDRLAAQHGAAAGGVNPIRADSADARYLGCPVSTCAAGVAAAASPITYVDAGDPPMLLVHGIEDRTVPVKQSQEMYERLRAAGVHAELLLIPGVDHSFIGPNPAATRAASLAALNRVFAFI